MSDDCIINRDAIRDAGTTILDNESTVKKADELIKTLKEQVRKDLEAHKKQIEELAQKLMTDESVINYTFEQEGL